MTSTVQAPTSASCPHPASVVEDIGRLAVSATFSDIPPAALSALTRNVLDSLGAAIAALDSDLSTDLRHYVGVVDGRPVATLIGGGRGTLAQATLVNSVLVRYVDQLDTYLAPGGLCHPADNVAAVLAAAESRDVDGEEFLTGLAVAYELGCRFSDQVPVMALGLNHALQLAISAAAAAGRLLGLDAGRVADAVAAAAVDNVSLSAVHSEPVSMWKGISPAVTAQRAVEVAALAAYGITGPRGLFEGPNGLDQLLGQSVDLHLDDPTLGVAERTHLKKYCALIHGQPVIESVLHLARTHQVRPEQVDHVRIEVFQTAYDIAGGGKFGAKDVVRSKEQADYNLAYLTAAALLDGQVGPEQLREDRIRRADVQTLMHRVEVYPEHTLTAGYPGSTPVRVHLTLTDGRRLTREQTDHEGAPSRPLTWDREVEKFSWLAAPHLDPTLLRDIVDAVAGLDRIRVRELTRLLARVSPTPHRPRTHRL